MLLRVEGYLPASSYGETLLQNTVLLCLGSHECHLQYVVYKSSNIFQIIYAQEFFLVIK